MKEYQKGFNSLFCRKLGMIIDYFKELILLSQFIWLARTLPNTYALEVFYNYGVLLLNMFAKELEIRLNGLNSSSMINVYTREVS